jgi:putative flippase GtrA
MSKLFIRYLLVGGLNTAFGYAVFAALTYQGQPYPQALFLATIAGILFNFKTFGRLVFAQSNWRLIWRFITVYGVLYVINVGCVFLLMRHIHNVYVANAITLVFIAGLGFLLNRRFVYANH